MIFTEKIEKLLASNYLKEVIDEFLKFLNEVPHSNKEAKSDAGQLRGQIIVLSGRFTDLNTKINTNTMDSGAANQEKSALINSFIQILNQLPSNFPDLNQYLEEKNEEDEWKEAQKKNTIEEYQDYFNKYPNGKYKADTIKLITELEEIKNKQELEMKRLALLEKERRENDKAAAEPAKAQAASTSNQAYQTTSASGSAAAARTYAVPPPSKSRTGLYIALGALLGIIFIIVIAVSVTDSEETTKPVEPQKDVPVPVYNVTTGYQWTTDDENKFLVECQGTAVQNVGTDRAVQYCDCMLQKMKMSFSGYEDANSKLGNLSQEEVNTMAADCNK